MNRYVEKSILRLQYEYQIQVKFHVHPLVRLEFLQISYWLHERVPIPNPYWMRSIDVVYTEQNSIRNESHKFHDSFEINPPRLRRKRIASPHQVRQGLTFHPVQIR